MVTVLTWEYWLISIQEDEQSTIASFNLTGVNGEE